MNHLFRHIALTALVGMAPAFACAQQAPTTEGNATALSTTEKQDNNMLNHLYGALSVGTNGIGIDLAMPIGDYVQVRAGYSFMPAIHHKMYFNVVSEQQENNGTTGTKTVMTDSKFTELADIVHQVTGIEMSRNVEMIGEPTYNNAKLLVDVFPFQNKRWHFTGGFYIGASRIAKAYNSAKDVATLTAVNMYNNIYDKVEAAYNDPMNPFHDVVLFQRNGANVLMPEGLRDQFYNVSQRYGHMGFQLGDYFLTPDKDNMVKANAYTNRFKPYLGFGYGDATPKAGRRYGFMLECGLLFWGGAPEVDCYGTDLTKQHVKGTVGDYINLIKGVTVFPVVNLRISRRIF